MKKRMQTKKETEIGSNNNISQKMETRHKTKDKKS